MSQPRTALMGSIWNALCHWVAMLLSVWRLYLHPVFNNQGIERRVHLVLDAFCSISVTAA